MIARSRRLHGHGDGEIVRSIQPKLQGMLYMEFKDNPPLTCFLITPFKDEFLPVSAALKGVIKTEFGGVALRADDIDTPGNIMEQVMEGIQRADFCIADVTGGNANVLWEAGYAHALDRELIQISQGTANLPFDIRALRIVTYSLGDLEALKKTTARAIAAILGGLREHPRILGTPCDELKHLGRVLSRWSVNPPNKDFLPVLSVIEQALANERERGSRSSWMSDEAERLMKAVARVNSSVATDVFWWLIVHGVFVYPDIDGPFQYCDGKGNPRNGWNVNLDLIRVSERGTRFLNQLKPRLTENK